MEKKGKKKKEKKNKTLSLRQLQSLGVHSGFACRILSPGRVFWHWLEQVEKMPLNFIIHFSGLVSS